MKKQPCFPHRARCACGAVLAFFGLSALLPARAQTAGPGTLTGEVVNAVSHTVLEGAMIEVPALRLSTLTDHAGRYVLRNLPAGDLEVRVSYAGLNSVQRNVPVRPGQAAALDFALTSEVYQMAEFVITGEREGNAASITRQRGADNVKNVVALDAYGLLPNMSAGELAVRLPGVAGNLDDEGNVTGLTIRGMGPTLNRITVDGGLIANVGGLNRQFQTHSLTGAMFDELEVIKGQLPDRAADSLGGSVNLKTRSPLNLKEKRRFDYNVGARWAPPFAQHIPLRREHPSHPLVNFAYQEVFDVAGGERNLGVALNMFYSENVTGWFRTIRDYQNTTNQPAYLWDYRTYDGYNNRKQSSVNLKTEYRLSPATKITLNSIYNDAFEPYGRNWEMRAFTSQNIAAIGANGQPTGTNAILPGFTNTVTQVRGVAASTVTIAETGGNFLNRTRAIDLGAEHDRDRWHVDAKAAYSQTHVNTANAGFGGLTLTATGIGWMLDRSQSDLYPRFVQTEGPSLADIGSYRAGPLGITDRKRNVEIADFTANARYELPASFPLALKTGAEWRRQRAGEVNASRRFNYTSTRSLPTDPTIVTWDYKKTGRVLPYFDTAPLVADKVPRDAALWSEDVYFREESRFTGTRDVTEAVTAGYFMAQGKAGRFGLLAGVRTERTEDDSFGWVKSHTPSTAAQQAADPVGSAARDYAGTARRIAGDYTKSFPSVHLTTNLTSRLKARASWSTGCGRPVFTNLLPNETANDSAKTLTISNPALKPQYAKNWDTSLEYYFEPVGMISAGWFQKTITDYIVSGMDGGTVGSGTGNGYNGEYAGYQLLTSMNAGTAYVQGWEFAYQQQFTFLPGLLRGISTGANYTILRTHGDFGGAANLTTNQVAGFIPETANFSLGYKYRKFSTSVLLNYTSRYLGTFSTSPGRVIFRVSRTVVNLSFGWQLRPSVNLFCNVSNLFNEPQKTYRYIETQMERMLISGTTINAGLSGRF